MDGKCTKQSTILLQWLSLDFIIKKRIKHIFFSYAWFQTQTSMQHEFDLKSQVWFQTKIAWHEVQWPLYYIYFEITQIQDLVSSNILLLQYWAGLKLNSSIFFFGGGGEVGVFETKVAKFAMWYSLSFIFLQFDWLL